jgi:hypothetical protein
MSHGPEHHLEEAEHAQHAAHNPFDRKVAMTMAIVAAVLACVTMLSHRAHNETLKYHVKANDEITERANQWAYYQAKKNRQYTFEADAELLGVLAKEMKGTDSAGTAAKMVERWEARIKKWEGEAEKIMDEANTCGDEAKKYEELAEKSHHRGDLYDLGELGVELSLVLCAVALLTKRKEYWLAGIVIGIAGAAVAASGLFLN